MRIYNARLLIRFPEHQNQAMLVFYHFSLSYYLQATRSELLQGF